MELVEVNDNNYKLLRLWRNRNHKYFLYQDYIDVEQHENWYQQIKKDVTKAFYVIYVDARPIGTIAYDLKTNELNNVLIADKKDRRRGYMEEAMKLLFEKLSIHNTDVTLRVLKTNIDASLFYQNKGFEYAGENRKELILRKHL